MAAVPHGRLAGQATARPRTAGDPAAGLVTAQQRRIRRLFAVLDDVAHYSADYASTKMLAHAWDRIGDLLLEADDSTIHSAVRRVGDEEVGSSGWWRAIRDIARTTDEHSVRRDQQDRMTKRRFPGGVQLT